MHNAAASTSMISASKPAPHPGVILRERFLRPRRITPYRLAKDCGLPHQRVNEILHGKRGISAETDFHLSLFFGQAPGGWLALQCAHDLQELVQGEEASRIRALVRPFSFEAAAAAAAKKRGGSPENEEAENAPMQSPGPHTGRHDSGQAPERPKLSQPPLPLGSPPPPPTPQSLTADCSLPSDEQGVHLL